MIEITSPLFIRPEQLPKPADWAAIFGNSQPLALEIGCGIGDFIARTATDQPATNFIAIDYYNRGCDSTCRRLQRLGIDNVRVVRAEARQFIADHLGPHSLAAVYINCPDPWPKKRHRKRRLVNRQFIDFISGYLAAGGDLFFATDFADYGIDVTGMLPGVGGLENALAPDLYRHRLDGYHPSKYMQKFMTAGKQIYFVHYRRIIAGTDV
jgi:tRNA (guanine-N7-)-methyltransferase